MGNTIRIVGLVVVIIGITILFLKGDKDEDKIAKEVVKTEDGVSRVFAFKDSGLKTNTAKASIPLDQVLSGGPGKDGIPAIFKPKFTNIKEAEKKINDDVDGLVVKVGDTVRFYPYNIMVWHEIVNDKVESKALTVTFCPLCGSAIVFEADIDGKREQFGVSGKLFESNLLMYDRSTESLWSQSIGTAVVGDRTGEELTVYPSQVLSFKTLKKKWPKAQVLSTDTGYNRNYNFYPYGNYDDNDELFFPVSVNDNRLPTKEIMYVVNSNDKSVAFVVKDLSENIVSVDAGGSEVTAAIIDGEIVVKDATGKVLPGYNEMWFSWATHHQEDGVVWQK